MAIELRWYQKKVQREASQAFISGLNTQVWVMPAGSGKTFTSGDTIRRIVESGKTAFFFCHKDDLIKQSYNSFKQLGMRCGIISAKFPKELDYDAPVQIISIPTWTYRGEKLAKILKKPDYGFFDECHHLGSMTWVNVYNYLIECNARVIGLTATPCRLDGKPLGKYFKTMIMGPTVKELIKEGSLSDYIYYVPHVLNMSKAKKVGGDYSKKDVKEEFEKAKIYGDIGKIWLDRCKGMKTIGFAPNIEQGLKIAEECTNLGIKCGFLDAKSSKEQREEVIGAFADGKIDILWNINLFSEGFDLSAQVGRDVPIEAVLLCRPTASLSLFIQQVTRALRKKPTKAIILDFVGNACNPEFGHPDRDREWSINEPVRSKKSECEEAAGVAVVNCTSCFRTYDPALKACPFCKEVREKTKREYEIDKKHELQELARIEKDERKTRKKVFYKKLYSCGSEEEMIKLYIETYTNGELNSFNRLKAQAFLRTGGKNAVTALYERK